jgi:hypothetical protein
MRYTLTTPRPWTARGAGDRPLRDRGVQNPFGIGAVLIGAGVFVVLAAFGAGALSPGGGLPLYAFALFYLALLLWWESVGSPPMGNGALPRWVSPPALICGWMLVLVYGPATVAFVDDRLIDEYAAGQGGEALLVSSALVVCGGLTALSFFYHFTSRMLRPRRETHLGERRASLDRIVALYLTSAAARIVRLSVLGVAFGQDLSSWGELQWADQWIGYVEDLRYLALALFVAHVVRHGSGRLWLLAALLVEVIFGATGGFFKPMIWPLVVCVLAAAALDRIRPRHLVFVAAGAVTVAVFLPFVTAIRDNRAGALGSGGSSAVPVLTALNAPGAVGLTEGAYLKFFGRQTEVATAPGLVAALTPDVIPYEGADQFLLLPTNLIPRALWPDKPVLSRGQWFSVNFRGLEETTTSSSAMTLFGESYLFFGWTGVVLGSMMAGVALAVLARQLERPGMAAVYLALVPTILEIEAELSSYFTSLVQRSVVFVVVFLVLTHRSKAT